MRASRKCWIIQNYIFSFMSTSSGQWCWCRLTYRDTNHARKIEGECDPYGTQSDHAFPHICFKNNWVERKDKFEKNNMKKLLNALLLPPPRSRC
jgi:hypothetical protein